MPFLIFASISFPCCPLALEMVFPSATQIFPGAAPSLSFMLPFHPLLKAVSNFFWSSAGLMTALVAPCWELPSWMVPVI